MQGIKYFVTRCWVFASPKSSEAGKGGLGDIMELYQAGGIFGCFLIHLCKSVAIFVSHLCTNLDE